MTKEHHVAWKDRIGLSERWEDAIKRCFYNYGTPGYAVAVKAFENLMINIKDGPALRNIINTYKHNELQTILEKYKQYWMTQYPQQSQNPSFLRDLTTELEKKKSEMLFNYMLQLLEDQNFCFYKSTVEEDEVSLH